MITIKASTKRGSDFLAAYYRSRDTRLSDVYGRYSTEKARAERDCLDTMRETGWSGYRILSHNQSYFTVGWITKDGNLRVETASNTYLVIDLL